MHVDLAWIWLYMPCHDHLLNWDYFPFSDKESWEGGAEDAMRQLFPMLKTRYQIPEP